MIEIDRDDFGVRQAEMTARWYENVQRTHGDVEAYIATRWSAYLDRWQEAARFIPNASHVLDIGGGNLFGPLLEFFKARDFRYHYLDVDPSCVESSQALALKHGLLDATFAHGFNDKLDYAAGRFDAIFSSHCIEHSIDLDSTFAELNRVLVDDGNLLMAVPFGWEENPEHPYFFGPQEWLGLVSDAGFNVRVAQIGQEYPEYGYDYFIAARKAGAYPGRARIDPRDYAKASFDFVPWTDDRVTLSGTAHRKDDHVILFEGDWQIVFDVPDGASEVLPVFTRHDWSGIAKLEWGDQTVVEDLYSWFAYAQPVRIKRGNGAAGKVKMSSFGRNPLSYSGQAVLHGVMIR